MITQKLQNLLKHVKEKKSLDVILNILSRSDPGEVDENNVTALIWECFNSLEDIALSIIAIWKLLFKNNIILSLNQVSNEEEEICQETYNYLISFGSSTSPTDESGDE